MDEKRLEYWEGMVRTHIVGVKTVEELIVEVRRLQQELAKRDAEIVALREILRDHVQWIDAAMQETLGWMEPLTSRVAHKLLGLEA